MPVAVTGTVTVLKRKEGNARTSGDGKFADSLKVVDDGDGRASWFDLAQHINGDCPAEGERVQLRISLGRQQIKAVSKAGDEYDKYVDRNVIVGFIRDEA